MGLDTVEIFMEIEKEFGIAIPDQIASTLLTVGETHREIVAGLVAKGAVRSPDLDADAWRLLVTIISKQMRMKPESIQPESRWVPDITKYG